MRKMIEVDGSSRRVCVRLWYLLVANVALASFVGCRQAVDTGARSELADAHAMSDEHPVRALETLDRLRDRFPDWAEPHVLAGRLHAIEGNTKEAGRALTRALERAPESRQAAIWYSRVAVAAGDAAMREHATDALETQIARDTGDARLYHALGLLFEGNGDVTGALGAYRMGIERLSGAARLHLDTARVYYRLGLTGRAEERAASALGLSEAAGGPVYEAALRLTARIEEDRSAEDTEARERNAETDGGEL